MPVLRKAWGGVKTAARAVARTPAAIKNMRGYYSPERRRERYPEKMRQRELKALEKRYRQLFAEQSRLTAKPAGKLPSVRNYFRFDKVLRTLDSQLTLAEKRLQAEQRINVDATKKITGLRKITTSSKQVIDALNYQTKRESASAQKIKAYQAQVVDLKNQLTVRGQDLNESYRELKKQNTVGVAARQAELKTELDQLQADAQVVLYADPARYPIKPVTAFERFLSQPVSKTWREWREKRRGASSP